MSRARLGILILVASISVGAGMAVLTGLIDVTPRRLVGSTWYGYPTPWLYRLIVAPQYYPWRVNWSNLIEDVGIWSVVALLAVLGVFLRRARRPTTSA